MSALHAIGDNEAANPIAASKATPANSNKPQNQPGTERRLLIIFFAMLASSMLVWTGTIVWGFLWVLGWV